jgi:leader peptidase (prepilin peptidase)/N-methyltransferase
VSHGLRVYLDLVAFLFGAAIGSFLNVCVHRMPRGQSIVSPPSHCPRCDHPIGWRDNIPLVSYIELRGRCRHCHAAITPRYFLVELLTATLFLLVVLKFGWQWIVPIYWLLLAGLIAATFIDFEHYIIPNELTHGGVVLGFCLSILVPALQHASSRTAAALQSFWGLLCGGLTLFLVAELGKVAFGRLKMPLATGTVIKIADNKLNVGEEQMPWEEIFSRGSDRIRFQAAVLKFQDKMFENAAVRVSETTIDVNGTSFELAQVGPIEATTNLVIIPREAMGLGDAKLLAGIGAFLGLWAVAFVVFASSMAGGVVSLVLILARRKDWRSRIPYGPYIALGAVIWIFYGRDLVDWYMGLMRG